MPRESRMNVERRPGTVEEARTMLAYNERILQTSDSAQRRERAERMIANVRPELVRLEREEASRLQRITAAAPPPSTFDGALQQMRDRRRDEPDYETVWSGGAGLSSYVQGTARWRN